ncbi:response regulator [Microcystis aeruginosa EAWAG127a]|uniref:Response regulator n=1 Tax=Microcystis aeruginosa EAWAG127a TaxID=2529855 RepID=A0A5J5M2H5_MICAE|nr:response regulator [Microcystis aeruginosa EAWAG127a]
MELEGFEVRTFSDAQSLLRKPDISRQAFLVIDYRLPDTNGLDLLQRLRAKGVSTQQLSSRPTRPRTCIGALLR